MLTLQSVQTLLTFLAAWSVAFGLATWAAALLWTYHDIRRRTKDRVAHVLALLVVLLFSLPGLALYLLLRPTETLEDAYRRDLEEEVLLQALETTRRCPGCARPVQPDWRICPWCHTQLRKVCHQCGRLLELPWDICPYCGTPVPGMRRVEREEGRPLLEVPPDAKDADAPSQD
ncbi:MAG: zinc ribbon domain-containing protein [Chloroflexi bacterium]|nr:zinc ribbon domain-containing protein [Chloroflexota bacterium]